MIHTKAKSTLIGATTALLLSVSHIQCMELVPGLVQLKNGTSVPEQMIPVMMMSLERLEEQNPLAFHELVMVARDRNHKCIGNTEEVIRNLALFPDNSITKNILRSATKGEGESLQLVSPVSEEWIKAARDKECTLQQQKAEVPSEKYQSTSVESIELFTQMKTISDTLWSFINAEKAEAEKKGDHFSVADGREGWPEPNPYYHQTKQGFFLEYYYGHPSSLWTPWGELKLVGSCAGGEWEKRVGEQILKALEAEEYMPEKYIKEYGVVGPVYKIRSLDGKPLPDPIEQNRNAYITYEDIKKTWSAIKLGVHDSNSETDMCCICLDPMYPGSKTVTVCPNNHEVCAGCSESLLRLLSGCPLCRAPIIK